MFSCLPKSITPSSKWIPGSLKAVGILPISFFGSKPTQNYGKCIHIIYVLVVPWSTQNHGKSITLFVWKHPLLTLDQFTWVHLTLTLPVFSFILPHHYCVYDKDLHLQYVFLHYTSYQNLKNDAINKSPNSHWSREVMSPMLTKFTHLRISPS